MEHQQYLLKKVVLVFDRSTTGTEIDPTSVARDDGDGAVSGLSLPIDIGQARSIEAEIDTTGSLHVATDVDINFYTGVGAVVPDTPQQTEDTIGDDEIIEKTITVGALNMWITLDHDSGTARAYVTVTVFIRY